MLPIAGAVAGTVVAAKYLDNKLKVTSDLKAVKVLLTVKSMYVRVTARVATACGVWRSRCRIVCLKAPFLRV